MIVIDILKMVGCLIISIGVVAYIGKKMIDNEDYFDG